MYDSIHAQLYAWMDWWMNACMHKCMYGCMHAWKHVGMYVCIYWYMHVWVCSYICMCVLFLYGQFAYSIADYFVGWCTWLDSKCHQKPCSHLRSYDELLRRSGLVSGCYHLSSGMFNTYLKNNHLWTDPCDIEGYRCLPKKTQTPEENLRKPTSTIFTWSNNLMAVVPWIQWSINETSGGIALKTASTFCYATHRPNRTPRSTRWIRDEQLEGTHFSCVQQRKGESRDQTTLNVDSFASKSRPVLQAKMPQTCFKSRHCPSHLNQIHLPRAVWVQLPATLFHDPSAQPKGDLWLRIWSKFEMTWRYFYRSLWNNDQSINHAQFPVVFLTFMLVCRTPWPRPYPCCHDGLNCTGKGHPTPWSNPLWDIAALPKR